MPAFFRQPLCSFGVHCVRTRKRGVPGVFGSRLKTPFLRIRLTALDLVEEDLVIESIKERVVPPEGVYSKRFGSRPGIYTAHSRAKRRLVDNQPCTLERTGTASTARAG